jgi:REP element-mobilizing transposase RayT
MKNTRQLAFVKREPLAYGGELLRTRKGRSGPRPLDTRNTIHLVLRSSKAKNKWSFRRTENENKITRIVDKFSRRYGVKVLSLANVGNHLHFQIKLGNRFTYVPFIRAITAAIAMAVTGISRWTKNKTEGHGRFWDYRPFTRVVKSYRGFINLRDYLKVNKLEGLGATRFEAKFILAGWEDQRAAGSRKVSGIGPAQQLTSI